MTMSIKHQQMFLLQAGFDPRGADGLWGPNTQSAYDGWKKMMFGTPQGTSLAEIVNADRLEGVHPDLIKVVERAAQTTAVPFTVLEGLRSVERQRRLVAKGASTTMNSRHIPDARGIGHAVDLGALDNGEISWSWPLYYKIADAMKAASAELGIPVEWGGDWKSFKDGPHWQLPWKEYPKAK